MWLLNQITADELNSPPELFYIMKSIADFDKKWNEQTPIVNLAEVTREKIFYGNYPLSENVNREEFEINILNHFIHCRIGFDTVTSFKIALINKLREIMPKYNLMFDLLAKDLEFFNTNHNRDLEEKTDDDFINKGKKNSEENGNYDKKGTRDTTVDTESNTEGTSDTDETSRGKLDRTTTGKRKEDLRESDTPQNRLSDVKDGSYVSKYNYNEIDTEEKVDETTSGSKEINGITTGKDTGTSATDEDWSEDGRDKTLYGEQTEDTGERDVKHILNEKYKTEDNYVEKMKSFNEISNIMTMIYNDLDILFLQVYDY